jgi:hypothetical protein
MTQALSAAAAIMHNWGTGVPSRAVNGHPVFQTDLAAGVVAVARAIGLRQARDLAYVLGHAPDHITGEGLLAHIFPAGDCASAIIEVARLAEAAIDGLDMSPITELMYDLNDRPIREQWSTPHDLLLARPVNPFLAGDAWGDWLERLHPDAYEMDVTDPYWIDC